MTVLFYGSYSFVEQENGVIIKMSGFHDKLPVRQTGCWKLELECGYCLLSFQLLFDTVTDYFANFTCDVKDFGLIKVMYWQSRILLQAHVVFLLISFLCSLCHICCCTCMCSNVCLFISSDWCVGTGV